MPCVAHFVHFTQQHIARTLTSNASSDQIPFRIYWYWQKSMPPKIYKRSAGLENSAILAAYCSSSSFSHVWADDQLATISVYTLRTNISAFHQIFNCLVKNRADSSFQYAPHHAVCFVFKRQLLQLRTCIVSWILLFSVLLWTSMHQHLLNLTIILK